jgi:hypothetical protein
MKTYNKITPGFVVQTYKILPDGTQVCTDQLFMASDQVDYETLEGEKFVVDTDKEVYCPFEMVQPKPVPTNGLKFTCPKCKNNRIECVQDGSHRSEVLDIDKQGDFDYGEIESNGEVERYQCSLCGYTLCEDIGNSGSFAIRDEQSVVEWIKENCPQGE